jgi:hypothetical protein
VRNFIRKLVLQPDSLDLGAARCKARKNKIVRFYIPECPVLLIMTIFQILDVLILKLDVPVSTN